jgi:hypothetical protein
MSRTTQRLRRALVGSAILVAVLSLASPAHANPYPNNYNLAVPGNGLHTYCLTDTFVTDPSVADYAMAVLGNTTDMTDMLMIDPPFCGFRQNDVWFWEEDLPAGTRGERSCELDGQAGICMSSDVRLDFPELDNGDFDWEDRRKTGVHEVGHSVGLGHDTISAMISGEIPDTTLQWRTYSAHDISHINTQF